MTLSPFLALFQKLSVVISVNGLLNIHGLRTMSGELSTVDSVMFNGAGISVPHGSILFQHHRDLLDFAVMHCVCCS